LATLGKFQNTDFETVSQWWSLQGDANDTATFTTNAVNARSGSTYMRLVASGTGAAYATAMATSDQAGTQQLYLPVVPGQIIQYGGWSYRESGTGAGYIAIVAYDANKATPVYANVPTSATVGSWQFQQGTYKVPAGKYFISFYVQVAYATASAQRFDDVFCIPALDVQVTTNGQITDQTAYLQYQSTTLKFNTFDCQLIDPTVIPNLGDAVTVIDPNLALSWSGTIAKIQHTSVSEKGGHTFVTMSATNTNVAVASVAPFDLSDNSQPMRNWSQDPGFEDATLTALEAYYNLGTPAEFSQDTGSPHSGTKDLMCTTTRTAVGTNAVIPNMPGGVSGGQAGTTFFPVAPGMAYTFTVWMKTSAGAKGNSVEILWYQDQGVTLSAITPSTAFTIPNGANAWTQLGGVLAAAPQDARYAQIQLLCGYWDGVTGTNATIQLDDLFFGGFAKFREASHSYSKDQSGTNKTSSSYLTQQTGLWPLQTVDITNADLGLINQGFTVTDVQITWDIDHITPWQRVTVGDPVVTMSVWLNSTNAGILPITTTKITDGAVTTPKVAANAITAAQIAAGAITADKLTSTLVLASLIKAGSGTAHVEMDQNGLRAYDGSGNLVVNIPTDGVSPVTINANVLAQSLIVSGNSVFQGTKNEIALGSTLQLDSSLQNPAQAPSIAQTWNSVSLPVNATYDKTSTTYSRLGLHYDSAGGAGGATAVFLQVTQNGGSPHDYLLELLYSDRTVNRAHDLTADGFQTPLGVCRLGSYVYVLGIDGGTGSPSSWGGTGSATYSWDYSGPNTDNQVSTASYYTAPGAGTITSITIRCSSYSGSSTFYFCLWDTSGNLLANSSGTALGTTLTDQTLGVSYHCSAGQGFYIGFWRTKANYGQWGVNSSGSFYTQVVSGISSLSGRTACASPYTCGDMRAFVTYTPDTRVWKVRRYVQSTLALDTTYASISQLAAPNTPIMCSDGTNVIIVDRASGSNMKYQKYDGSMATVGSLVDTGVNPGNQVMSCAAGSFDLGAWRLLVQVYTAEVYSFDGTTPTPVNETANEGFYVAGNSAGGLTYDGTRFFSLPANGGAAVNLTSHSTWVWTTASSVYWVAYTWYDSQVSHIHETMVSPYASITLSRRAQLVITAPSIPGTGGLDDPNNIRYYALPNATQPATGAAKQQASQSATTLTMTTYASGGAADPSSNNFPVGSAGIIQSETGSLVLKGDGTGTVPVRIGYNRLAVTAASVTFSGIPQSWTHLKEFVSGRNTSANNYSAGLTIVNGDATGGHYETERTSMVNGSTGTGVHDNTTGGFCQGPFYAGSAQPAGSFSPVEYTFYDYAYSNVKTCIWQWGLADGTSFPQTNQYSGVNYGVWNSTAAITSITNYADATGTVLFAIGSLFTLEAHP